MKQNTVNIRRLEGYGLWNGQTLKELVTEALAECDWWGYVWLHENSWRLDSFFNLENLMSDREYWSLLGHVWLHCNAPHERFRDWLRLWQSSRPHQEFVMDQQERTAFAAFPDQLTIYRGVHVERGILQGFSWTLDRQRAEWFANCRAKNRPFLVQAEVCRSNVRAHFLARGEAEIIVLPNRLVTHTVKEIPLNKALEVEKVYWQTAKRFVFSEARRKKESA